MHRPGIDFGNFGSANRTMSDEKIVYLDNNGTTLMSDAVWKTMGTWTNRGNPSAGYSSGREAHKMMRNFRQLIAAAGHFKEDEFETIFTSGGSESNSHILTSSVRAFRARTKMKPRVITSIAEHSSIIKCCRDMERLGEADVVFLPVRNDASAPTYGTVDPADLEAALSSGADAARTCLVSIMAANNETGAVNPILDLARRSYAAKVPFHTDAVQLFGKSPIRPDHVKDAPIDAFSVSFHKLEGPLGCGLLVVRKTFLEGYGLCPLICGAQNDGRRGGTENLPAIAASFRAYRIAMTDRGAKNARLRRLREMAFASLAAADDVASAGGLAEYMTDGLGPLGEGRRIVLVRIRGEGGEDRVLPNTLLIAGGNENFCNLLAQKALDRRGILVGIGSTCNAAGAAEPSHVIKALDVPEELRAGVLRISLGDSTTESEIRQLGRAWADMLKSGECFLGA